MQVAERLVALGARDELRVDQLGQDGRCGLGQLGNAIAIGIDDGRSEASERTFCRNADWLKYNLVDRTGLWSKSFCWKSRCEITSKHSLGAP